MSSLPAGVVLARRCHRDVPTWLLVGRLFQGAPHAQLERAEALCHFPVFRLGLVALVGIWVLLHLELGRGILGLEARNFRTFWATQPMA